MHNPHHTDRQPPSKSRVVAKSLLFGGMLVFCEAIFFIIIMSDMHKKISNRDKIIASGMFVLTLAATLTYGLCRPQECGDSESTHEDTKIGTPTVANGRFFAAENNEGVTTDALLSHQPSENQDLTPRH